MNLMKVTTSLFLVLGLGAYVYADHHNENEKMTPEAATAACVEGNESAECRMDRSIVDEAIDKRKIRDVQRSLNTYGYELEVDGSMGENTRDAIRKFQRQHNLEVTGEMDAATVAALQFRDGEDTGRMPASVPEKEDVPEASDDETAPLVEPGHDEGY